MLMHEDIVARTKTKAKYTESGEWLLTSKEFVDWDNGNGKYQVIWLFGTGLPLSLKLHDSSAVNSLNSRHGKDNTDVGVAPSTVFVLVTDPLYRSKVIEWHLSRSSLYSESPFAVYYCSDSSGQRRSDSIAILRS